ncbi:MAG: DUF2236 domain-containing protein [Actinomycetota bacterium]|nr:DUF2236 domain-containing protein [Actinomycetota bacterium]
MAIPSTAGYFGDASMLRRVQRETAVQFSGPRALLMQAAHPLAFAGFFAHTGALDDPYGRLSRTAQVLGTIGWGSRAEADRATRRVRAMHRRVRGELVQPVGRFPAGTAYAADDPRLLLWILATLVDSALVVHDRCVETLTRDERDAFWRDYRVIGRLFGLQEREMPGDIDAFDDYMDEMIGGDDLHVTEEARDLAVGIVMRPPVPLKRRPVLELVNFVTVGLLPARLRRQYGFSWDPLRELALRGGAEGAKRVLVPLAPERLRLTPRARAHAA